MGQFLEGHRQPVVLVTRDHRRLTAEELADVIAEVHRDGLLATAERWQLGPGDLYGAVIRAEE